MKNRKLSQLVVAGLLAAVLGVPGIARAEGGREAGSIGAWEWLVSLWEEGVSALWAGSQTDQGLGVDPNGGEGAGSEGDAGPGVDPNGGGAGSQTDQGHGIDPNGGG